MPAINLQILPAVLEDTRAVSEIHVKTWRDTYMGIIPDEYLATQSVDKRETMWREIITTGMPILYVAKCDSLVVGWISFGSCRDGDASGGDAEVLAIYVTSSHWSSGIGCALWLKARSFLIDQGYKRVMVWVLADNKRAIDFYLAAGFSPDSEKEVVMANKILKEVRYVAMLSN